MMIEQLLDQEQESIVDVEKLSVTFGSQEVLKDITLRIPPGQTLALLGESGCGKTVLMKSIIGLVKPTVGTIEFDGENINQLTERQLSRMRLRYGFIFQNAALFDSMTIGQNVAFPLRQHGRFSDNQIREMVLSRLSEVGLPDSVVFKKPAELSGGMRKRVGLARALIMNPELIMYDEPTTGLDPIMSDVINELILRTRSRNPVTSIVVTHDMHTARKVADRVVMLIPRQRLDPGENQVIFDGSVKELESCRDRRVQQFVNGEAGERLMEMRANGHDQ
ncbi:MAG: ABC transporter ATP-binding protein [Planctomycetaceae bacterium]|jgi:phospholipid/cholesterol/gamma-HCH transport system ATP-binding protein|nr:ABC transporter ATP-binding protein [Planctomycetaceae bacterium]MCP4479209.1 ABC transporter ATP-binding protein [Planctomycetaceae bacterium]MCP4778865.1 ABC transporter ATP-binding protein [Planctomycetaceae bacterium]